VLGCRAHSVAAEDNTLFHALVLLTAVVAGAIAAVSGFGIGSLLTPLLAVKTGTKAAVAVVSVPHFLGTALRLWRLRAHVDRRVFLQFGVMSAVGGLAGALLHSYAGSPQLRIVFGVLLILAGVSDAIGLAERLQFGRTAAWIAGVVSGVLGGLVGNQGGIRSAALLGFHVEKRAFVATATASGIIVDLARLPVYAATGGTEMAEHWLLMGIAAVGVIAGTLIGEKLLHVIPETIFHRIVSGLLILLGAVMLLGITG
jgi:uncharacterized membrane protein YfcA